MARIMSKTIARIDDESNDMDEDENKDEDMYKTNNEDEGKKKVRAKTTVRMMTKMRSKVLGMTTKIIEALRSDARIKGAFC